MNFSKLLNIILLFYILSLYLLTFREGYNNLSNFLAALFVFCFFIYAFFNKKRIRLNKTLFAYGAFALISLFSTFYSLSPEIALNKSRTLLLIFFMMFVFANYIDNIKKLKILMKYFVYSGSIASIFIISEVDFTNPTRYGTTLGNPNTIGIIIGISFIFAFYFTICLKKIFFIPLGIIMFLAIILTGSRTAIFFVLTNVVTIFLLINRKKPIHFLLSFLFIIFLIFIFFYLVFYIQFFYNIIGKRLENLFKFIFYGYTTEFSMNLRMFMLKIGIHYFFKRPILGYGIDNFRVIFKNFPGGRFTYSHNNFIELLFGTGIIGFILYYLTFVFTILDLIKLEEKSLDKFLVTIFATIFVYYVFLSFGTVFYYHKHIHILIASVSNIRYFSRKKYSRYFSDSAKSNQKTKKYRIK